jgi:hypothetical protein
MAPYPILIILGMAQCSFALDYAGDFFRSPARRYNLVNVYSLFVNSTVSLPLLDVSRVSHHNVAQSAMTMSAVVT